MCLVSVGVLRTTWIFTSFWPSQSLMLLRLDCQTLALSHVFKRDTLTECHMWDKLDFGSTLEQSLCGYSERWRSSWRHECSSEVSRESCTCSRTQGLRCPWRLWRTRQRIGEDGFLWCKILAIILKDNLKETVLLSACEQIFEMEWHNVAGWTGQGGSLLGTKR